MNNSEGYQGGGYHHQNNSYQRDNYDRRGGRPPYQEDKPQGYNQGEASHYGGGEEPYRMSFRGGDRGAERGRVRMRGGGATSFPGDTSGGQGIGGGITFGATEPAGGDRGGRRMRGSAGGHFQQSTYGQGGYGAEEPSQENNETNAEY